MGRQSMFLARKVQHQKAISLPKVSPEVLHDPNGSSNRIPDR